MFICIGKGLFVLGCINNLGLVLCRGFGPWVLFDPLKKLDEMRGYPHSFHFGEEHTWCVCV